LFSGFLKIKAKRNQIPYHGPFIMDCTFEKVFFKNKIQKAVHDI